MKLGRAPTTNIGACLSPLLPQESLLQCALSLARYPVFDPTAFRVRKGWLVHRYPSSFRDAADTLNLSRGAISARFSPLTGRLAASGNGWAGFWNRGMETFAWSSNTRRLMDILEESNDAKLFASDGSADLPTCEKIAERGFEVATTGMHTMVHTQTEAEFRTDIREAKAILEDASGGAVQGYRAAGLITQATPWAFRVLREEGFRYDASVFQSRPGGFTCHLMPL